MMEQGDAANTMTLNYVGIWEEIETWIQEVQNKMLDTERRAPNVLEDTERTAEIPRGQWVEIPPSISVDRARSVGVLGRVDVDELEEEDFNDCIGWDDVNDVQIPLEMIKAARREEVQFMKSRNLWSVVPKKECLVKTGKPPVSVRWVDTNKGRDGELEIRSRLVARDFKGNDKDRDDLFAETPPLEAKRMLLSRAATNRKDGRRRKLMFIDVRKAHLNPVCEQDVYIELPDECGDEAGVCGKLNFWLYGFRPAAAAWEKLYSQRLESVGFVRGKGCGVVFWHQQRDIALAVHGDDFTFCGLAEDLRWIQDLMASWFDIKLRAILGDEPNDQKEVVILGRVVRWGKRGIEYEADPKHRRLVLEAFGLDDDSKSLAVNGHREDRQSEEWENELLDRGGAKRFRALAARLNFMSLDCPDLQFPIKQCSRDMANPKNESWRSIKKVARYLVGRKKVVWRFWWQDEPTEARVYTDSDWGGNLKDRKSTSGGAWFLGNHCIKTWSCTQGAYALSSAEAEFYAMIEGTTRAKGLHTLARELGFVDLANVVKLGTDSSAAKSFVSRRGLGRMRHLEIRDLWLQQQVRDGLVEVSKVPGERNPADLMTKILPIADIRIRVADLGMELVEDIADRGASRSKEICCVSVGIDDRVWLAQGTRGGGKIREGVRRRGPRREARQEGVKLMGWRNGFQGWRTSSRTACPPYGFKREVTRSCLFRNRICPIFAT